MKDTRLEWRIVLVRPRNPLNIGAAARAMSNFGLRDLVLVDPYAPTWQEARSAVGAEETLRSARAVGDLREAIEETSLVVGTTTGSHRNLDRDPIPLHKFQGWLQTRKEHHQAALLFGSEKTGLGNEHLSFCHALIRIPTAAGCPSMNLGQAVAVCCYELACSGATPLQTSELSVHRSSLANVQSLEHALDRVVRILERVGYLRPNNREAQLIKLRRLLYDLSLTNHDVRILGAVLAQIEWGIENLKE